MGVNHDNRVAEEVVGYPETIKVVFKRYFEVTVPWATVAHDQESEDGRISTDLLMDNVLAGEYADYQEQCEDVVVSVSHDDEEVYWSC